jgi:hypothetical protein
MLGYAWQQRVSVYPCGLFPFIKEKRAFKKYFCETNPIFLASTYAQRGAEKITKNGLILTLF